MNVWGHLHCAHHRCRISAGLRWFWGCYSSGLTSVRSPVCCLWRGRLSLCTSGRTGTSLKSSKRWREIKCVAAPPHPHPSLMMPTLMSRANQIRKAKYSPTPSLQGCSSVNLMLSLYTTNTRTLRWIPSKKPNFHEPTSNWCAAVDFLLWKSAGNQTACPIQPKWKPYTNFSFWINFSRVPNPPGVLPVDL